MRHLPLLRQGTPYKSLDRVTLRDVRNGEPVVEVSQANRGLLAHDLGRARVARRALLAIPMAEMLGICRRAGALFSEGELPAGDELQSPAQYARELSATTGMPLSLIARNTAKIRFVLEEMQTVLDGLTRGLDLGVLDAPVAGRSSKNRRLSYRATADALGAILPGNSPGVHSLWLPSIALRVPVVLKPGREEPWTPFRIAQALIAAGCPKQALSFYPTDHGGAIDILLRCSRSLLFGDGPTVAPWRSDPRVEIHGPGFSKVILGADEGTRWQAHLDLIVRSVAENGGRSCVNASGVWVAKEAGSARLLAEALADRLAAIPARGLEDPEAALAAFPSPQRARQISAFLDQKLLIPGALDLTASRREERLVTRDGLTFLLPTVIFCEDPTHPLAFSELLFPFVSVVEVPSREIAARIGPTLVASAFSQDEELLTALGECPSIDRLNVGPIPTNRIAWDQPHEGNLFELLYRRRAFEAEPLAAA